MPRKKFVVDIQVLRFCSIFGSIGITLAFYVDFENDGITVGSIACRETRLYGSRVDIEGNETETMGKNFVLDDGRVVEDIYVLNSYCRNLAAISTKFTARVPERTSAIIILRNALAMEASTPTISKSIERLDSRLTCTFRFCPSWLSHYPPWNTVE